jgi:hypothetical protein
MTIMPPSSVEQHIAKMQTRLGSHNIFGLPGSKGGHAVPSSDYTVD